VKVVLVLVRLAVAVLADPVTYEETTVNLRVEGRYGALFEGNVSTCGHRVTLASGKKYHCNGTNNDSNPCPGPTCTTALDDSHIGFDGNYWEKFDDIFITSIGGEAAGKNEHWVILLNFQPIPVGGCQQQVKGGDDVLFALANAGTWRRWRFLKLSGPITARAHQPVILTVTDGRTGNPVEGAVVPFNGQDRLTDVFGRVSIAFTEARSFDLKAQIPGSFDWVRSNRLIVDVT